MLLIIDPVAIVVRAIGMRVSSFAVSLIIDPLAFVDIAISMDKLTLPIGLIILPLALILRTIWPHLGSVAISHTIEPLSSVDGPVFKSNWVPSDPTVVIDLFALLSKLASANIS